MSKVYLLGAGPGDPGLLTVKAKNILEQADVVIYDYLANKIFLSYCRKDADIIYVGKKGGDHTLPQDKINELIVAKAAEGKVVARLKGGDPYVFGRGAEEAEELLQAGLSFEVVPGVTSAVAAPAYAGIPLTHRNFASSVSFITGHEDPTKPDSSHNWKSLATGTSTLVFFMGVKNLEMISSNLMQNGMRGDMPAALVRWGTTCEHRSMVSDVANIARRAKEEGFKPPSLLVVGEVVQLRDRLNWFEQKPLLGKGVVITRAREQASNLLQLVQDMGGCCYEFPTISIKPLPGYGAVQKAISNLADYKWLIFTSVNGVRYFWQQLAEMGLDSRQLGGCKVAAIGPATAEILQTKGIMPDFVPPKYVAESVIEGLLENGIQGCKVLIPRAMKAREVLPEKLQEAGAEVEVLPVYETVLAEQDGQEIVEAITAGKINYLTFTSSSTVENFFALVKPESIRKFIGGSLKIACIGPITAETLGRFGFKPDIMPDDYTVPALAQALIAK